ncbi:FAD/NAD(P)-binding protein [Pelagibius sp.]|uniref:FAD/NAD(P)-binding protein n=1 Tax=Pelagibius sp. TaxID=1931238 RepID=UPI00260F7716|nr:FAD/NAD(P)-binding protein [Pelagibius sp.]
MSDVQTLDRPQAAQSGGMLPSIYEVRRRRRELADCVTLEMAPLEGAPLSFAPGQFTMLYVHGVGEIAVSISGNPGNGEALVQTVRSVGAVSKAVCGLAEGARLGVRGPLGVPWPVEQALGKHLMVVAGGLGLAPTRPIIYWALANRDRLKSISIVYGTRSPDQILYAPQLLGWSNTEGLQVGITVDRAGEDWTGRVGVVTELIAPMLHDPAETVAMLCGPEIMMRFAADALADAGVSQDDVYLSLERNMKCGIGWCGHCQLGPHLLCRDGPVFAYPAVRDLMTVWEL